MLVVFPWLAHHQLAMVPQIKTEKVQYKEVVPMCLINLAHPPEDPFGITYHFFMSSVHGLPFTKLYQAYRAQIHKYARLFEYYQATADAKDVPSRLAKLTALCQESKESKTSTSTTTTTKNKPVSHALKQWFGGDYKLYFDITTSLLVEYAQLEHDRVWIALWSFFKSHKGRIHLTHPSFIVRMQRHMQHRITVLQAACLLMNLWIPQFHSVVPLYREIHLSSDLKVSFWE